MTKVYMLGKKQKYVKRKVRLVTFICVSLGLKEKTAQVLLETFIKISSTYNDQFGKLFYIYLIISRGTI